MRRTSCNWFARALAGLCGLSSCSSDLVADVSPEVCASGKRWVGDLTPSEEMYPGADCLGCHRGIDGPEMMAAGTIYGVQDPTGALTTESDCFGVEGVQVTITAADGQVLQTVTNRAGNFYFEGREDSLAKPFRVTVEYTSVDGVYTREPMTSRPSYGGCGRCHRPDAKGDAEPGGILGRDDVVDDVYPIFTGPVSP